MVIRVLPRLIVDQIAAGEVIERPASVVKELVENAVDAGAQRIEVDLEGGGGTLVRVADDGDGIGFDELALAFASHATSKLADVSDLEHIATLGFRGEALASIGSVARARIRSRRRDADAGGEIENIGGTLGEPSAAGGPVGTTVEIRDLYFNTPARRKFLKRDSTELGHAVEAVVRLALAHPKVAFVVRHNGKEALRLEAAARLVDRARAVLGREFVDAGLELELSEGGVEVHGVLGKPADARRDARQYLFLNGRYIRDRALQRAMKDAYGEFLFGPVQPAYVLHLSMDPAQVDPNVHPTKVEVRFRDAGRLFALLRRRVEDRLREAGHATPGGRLLEQRELEAGAEPFPDLPTPLRVREGSSSGTSGPSLFSSTTSAPRETPWAADRSTSRPEPTYAAPPAHEAKFLQVHDRYVLLETGEGFVVIDQHALHERVNYEDLKSEMERSGIAVQALLQPEVREVSPATLALVEEHREELGPLGVDLRPFGPRSIALFGLPARLANADPTEFLDGVLEVLERMNEGGQIDREEFLRDALASRACRSSVMAGDVMRPDQIRRLLERAASLENDSTCPHGRPTRVAFSVDELDRAFKRT